MKIINNQKRFSAFLFSAILFLIFPFYVSEQYVCAKSSHIEVKKSYIITTENFLRTELYFGMNKADGSIVSEDEWEKFLSEEVTPRFPQGFTSLQANGQYQGINGVIVKENSRVIVFLYPLNKRRLVSRKIEQIRNLYKRKFLQESVLRLDFPQAVRVSF